MPPIGYSGNSITKEARAKSGGGFESAIEVVPAPTGAPSISSVTDNGDGTLTILGSEFGVKAQAAPITFERFEGTAGQKVDAYNPDWIAYSDGGSTIRSERSHSGSTSAGVTRPGDAGFATNYFKYPASDVVRGSYWVFIDAVDGDDYRAPAASTGTQVKLTRITSTADSGGDGPYNGAGDFVLGGMTFTDTSFSGPVSRNNGVTVLDNAALPDPSTFIGLDRLAWNRVDMMIKLSDPGIANGEMRVIVSGPSGTTNRVWKDIVTRGAGQSFQQDAIILGNMIANFSSEFDNPLSVFTDDVYVDTSWAAVEIGDNPDYYACTRRDLLPPSAWSGSSLIVDKNFGPVPSGTNYIFVMNSEGEVNANGYEVII